MQLSCESGISTENFIFLVDEFEILFIFDTLYSMKKTRNNLYKHYINLE